MNAALRMFDLAGADDRLRFSPYCWRIRLALAHKGLPVETLPWRFTDKPAIAPSGQGKVPVLVDGDQWLCDSWAIAEYLERSYPETPSLFGGASGHALARFINQWATEVLHPAVARVVLADIPHILHEQDLDYFRTTREAAWGQSLQALAEQSAAAIEPLRRVLTPLRSTLAAQPFVAGEQPNYADHIVFGAFQWARVVSAAKLLDDADPIGAWVERMLDSYGAIARATPARSA